MRTATMAPTATTTTPQAPAALGPVKTRRRPVLIIASVAALLLSALGGVWLWTAATSSVEVVVARAAVPRGAVIAASDLVVARVSLDPAIASVSGSLGVTTLAVGLALTWPRPVVLVEADPSGGSAILAGYCTGVARPGLSELVLAHRHHQLADELPSRLFPLADSNASLLPGLRAHQQAASLLGVWDALLDALRALEVDTGVDIVVDAGRLGMVGSPEPLISESDVTVVVTGTGLPELARVRSWLPGLQEGSLGDVRLVIAGPARRYSTSEVTKTLGVPVVGEVAWDSDAARWWSHGEPQRRFDRSPLPRSVVALGESLRALAPRAEDAPPRTKAGAER